MYPLCCIDIRNFLNQFYFFANGDFSHPNVIDETLKDVSIELYTDSDLFTWLISAGAGRPSFAESMRYPGRAAFLPISRSDCSNLDQLGTFRVGLS